MIMDLEQQVMGGVFASMGLGTLLLAEQLLPMSLMERPLTSPALNLVFRCFGAQATLCGVLILSAKFTRRTYKVFGLAILPFVVFDYLAWEKGMLTTFASLGDLAGNIVFMSCCWAGYQRKSKETDNDEE